MTKKILIVEDEEALATMLRYNLEKSGFSTLVSESAEQGLTLAVAEKADLILLDWMLPEMSGIEFCKMARMKPELREVPIIMLTARSEEADKIKGLSVGADDYVTKPFSVAELIARIKALLRRLSPTQEKGTLEFGGIEMDLSSCKVTRKGEWLHLGPIEFRLLHLFLSQPKYVFSREALLEKIWGTQIHVELRTVDVHIRRLRKAINLKGEPDLIRTVRAFGYALDDEASASSESAEEEEKV